MKEKIAVLDACVLYPAPWRDFLMHLTLLDLFRARWSEAINAEWIRKVLAQPPDLRPEQLARTKELMNTHARDALHIGRRIRIPHSAVQRWIAEQVNGGTNSFPPERFR